MDEYWSDIEMTWKLILISIVAAFIMGLVWMLIVKLCACVLVWACIGAYFVGVGFSIYFSWKQAEIYK